MRNVIDYYKYWKTDAIKADLDKMRHNFSVLCCNIQGDFNIGTVIRNANAFLAREVLIYGRKTWDKRGAVGTHHYTSFNHVNKVCDLEGMLKAFTVIGVDNVDEAECIDDFKWPDDHFILAFGEENGGLPDRVLSLCDNVVYIKQYGSVRSLNVGCASAIAMHDICRKIG